MAPCPRVQSVARLSVFPIGRPVHVAQYTYTWLGTQINTDGTLSTHTGTNSTNGLIPFPSLADQNEGPFVGNTYPHLQCGSFQSAQ